MFDILSYFAAGSTYYLYQAVDEDGQLELTDFADAVKRAVDDNIDVLNLSAGRERPNCLGRSCGFCRTARRAIERGTTIVAAAGNSQPSTTEVIHCPALAEPAIAVAGFVVECTYSEKTDSDTIQNPLNPPRAYWAKMLSGVDYPLHAVDDAFCSTQGCWPEANCSDYQNITTWENNPLPSGQKPDILAPVHYSERINDQIPFLLGGTSYAAPIVSAVVAWVLGVLLDNQLSASPQELRNGLIQGGVNVEPGVTRRLDADSTLDEILNF